MMLLAGSMIKIWYHWRF